MYRKIERKICIKEQILIFVYILSIITDEIVFLLLFYSPILFLMSINDTFMTSNYLASSTKKHIRNVDMHSMSSFQLNRLLPVHITSRQVLMKKLFLLIEINNYIDILGLTTTTSINTNDLLKKKLR